MTEADLIDLSFTKQVQDACCDPQIYTYYKVVGNGQPFITPASDTITDDNWAVENYAINFKTYIKSELATMINLMEANPLIPPPE